MKFVRHLLVVLAVIVVIMALGFAWKHSPAAGLVTNDRRDGRELTRTGTAPSPFEQDHRGDNRGNHGLDVSRADDLVQTLVVLGVIVGGVVVFDRVRRRAYPVAPVS